MKFSWILIGADYFCIGYCTWDYRKGRRHLQSEPGEQRAASRQCHDKRGKRFPALIPPPFKKGCFHLVFWGYIRGQTRKRLPSFFMPVKKKLGKKI